MTFPVILERDETGMMIAECPAIPGCVSQGKTEEEFETEIPDEEAEKITTVQQAIDYVKSHAKS